MWGLWLSFYHSCPQQAFTFVLSFPLGLRISDALVTNCTFNLSHFKQIRYLEFLPILCAHIHTKLALFYHISVMAETMTMLISSSHPPQIIFLPLKFEILARLSMSPYSLFLYLIRSSLSKLNYVESRNVIVFLLFLVIASSYNWPLHTILVFLENMNNSIMIKCIVSNIYFKWFALNLSQMNHKCKS